MPLEGDSKFKQLKKEYSKGIELRGKTIGIIGFGRIGQEVAKIALGIGMDVKFYDIFTKSADLEISFFDGSSKKFSLSSSDYED